MRIGSGRLLHSHLLFTPPQCEILSVVSLSFSFSSV